MTSRTATRRNRPSSAARRSRRTVRVRARRRWASLAVAAVVVAVIAVLYGVFRAAGRDDAPAGGAAGRFPFSVGQPGPGQRAPEFTLASTAGAHQSLPDWRGQTVLLYFQEGLMCQPCWDQITDLEASADKVKTAGVDRIVSITIDPIDLVARKATDMRLTTPVLSDPDLAVSKTYQANQYGMMGTSRDGHSLILVGPDGTITWRADYGGAPKYTMFVPVDNLLADLRAGTAQAVG